VPPYQSRELAAAEGLSKEINIPHSYTARDGRRALGFGARGPDRNLVVHNDHIDVCISVDSWLLASLTN
jgi:hypothetical protein